MKSTSCKEIARETLALCLEGRVPKELPKVLCAERCSEALFGVLVEGLADRFEPVLCDAYARLFSQAVAYTEAAVDPASLVARYERVRKPRPVGGRPHRIFVLSRVTLGADVAVTSVIMAAAKRRFPHAEIVLVGPRKNYELFAGDPRIHHMETAYPKGSLAARLSVWQELKTMLDAPNSVVIDPDSRLTQLGLLPVCPEERYHFFESRAYGAESSRSLPELASEWAQEVFGIAGAKPFVSLGRKEQGEHVAVSLGVGENPAKRLPDPFEEDLLRLLGRSGARICIDKGAGGEEAERVARAVERSEVDAAFWEGSFAGFAAIIAGSRLYVGYDSAGQHVAAASGVPLISVFAGYPAERTLERWRPVGEGCDVIPAVGAEVSDVLEKVASLLNGARTLREVETRSTAE